MSNKVAVREAVVMKDAVLVDDPAIKNVVQLLKEGKFKEAIEWIVKKANEEEQMVNVPMTFSAYPVDGAVAFYEVLRERYGWLEQLPERTFWGPKPPTLLSAETVDGIKEVPWGRVAVPNIEGEFMVTSTHKDGMWKFHITATVKQKHRVRARELMDLTAARLLSHSIYKGQTISLKWEEEKTTEFTQGTAAFGIPKFIVPSNMVKEDLILPEDIAQEVDATIFSLIENAEKARAMGIPTKRLILLAGPFGVGKTLTATVTAEVCRRMGRTFAYLRNIGHLADAVYFLQPYAPACIFGEDIDSVDEKVMDEIANTIDGIDTKKIDIIFILTTNHPDEIPEKFLRPGRSDMVIRFTSPDAAAAARLVLRYGGDILKCTYEEALKVGEEMALVNMIPASIREAVERAKLFSLARGEEKINPSDLHRATRSVIQQLDLLKREPDSELPAHMEKLGMLVRHKENHVVK